jgi:outer membrane protein
VDEIKRVEKVKMVRRCLSLVMSALIAGLLGANSASAQQDALPDLSEPLTLEDCLAIGLDYASAIRTSTLSLQSSGLQVEDARTTYLPSVQTSGAYLANDRTEIDFERENFDWAVTADYTIWDHGRRRIGLAQARDGRDSAAARLERTRQDLVLDIVQAYYSLLEGKTLVAFDEDQLEVSRGNAEQIRAMQAVGSRIPADIAAAEVRVASDELALLNDQNSLAFSAARLPTVLGFDPDTIMAVADDRSFPVYRQTGQFAEYTQTREETIELALRQRSEILESELGLRIQGWSRDRARLQRLPVVTARVNYGVDLDDYLHEREAFKDFRSWDAMARVTFPIFDGGTTRRELERAELDIDRSEEQHAELTRSIGLDVTQSYLNLKEAEKRLRISAVQVRNAQLNLDVTTERFRQDLVIPLELFDAQTQFGLANTTQIRAFYGYKIAQHALDRAVGKAVR